MLAPDGLRRVVDGLAPEEMIRQGLEEAGAGFAPVRGFFTAPRLGLRPNLPRRRA